MKKSILTALTALMAAMTATATDYTLPFSLTPSEETLAECKVIDVNEDGESSYGGVYTGKWFYYKDNGSFKYSYNMSNQANDWLILPVVNFGDCKKVKVSFAIATYSDKEDLEIKLGHAQTVDAMTVPVKSLSDFTTNRDNNFTVIESEITVPDDGQPNDWCLGFHVTSPAFRGWIYIKDIKIENADGGATAAAPAAPVVKSSTITDLSYTAVVTMPTLDTAGAAIEGNMDLRITVDGTLTDTKTACAPGADVDVALTLAAGEHTIGYQAVLNGQASEEVTVKVEAKEHAIVPAAPVIKSCVADFLTLNAAVTMPTLDTDGNAIDARMALHISIDGTVVSTKTYLSPGEEVAFTRALSAGSHTIGFQAQLGNEFSEIVTATVEAKEQTFTLPFTFNPSADNFSQCVVINANNDSKEWAYSDDALVYTYSSNNDADDWVILPMVDFGDVKKVKVSFDVKTVNYPENFEVKLGSSRTIQAMTTMVIRQEDYNDKEYKTLSATVELPADAASMQALGIHAFSKKDQNRLYITNIRIESAEGPVIVPSKPVVKESKMNVFDYTATVTMPSLDTDGNALTTDMSLRVIVDGEVAETKTDCAPGADVEVAMTLEAGEHTIGFQAVLGEEESEIVEQTVKAVSVTTGQLPWSLEATQETFDQCEIFDLDGSVDNGGNIQGEWSFAMGQGFKYTYNPGSKADDWLILPLVDFGESNKVKISVDVMTEYDTEDFEIFLGKERTVEGMTLKVIEKSGFTSRSWTTLTAEVTIPKAESRSAETSWALGVHATSPANHYLLYFNNFKIEAVSVSTGIEDVVADEAAEPEYYNLQGVRVMNPASGIYIVRRGNKVTKELVK